MRHKNAGRACSIDQCDRPAKSRSWCATHYARWRRYGNPTTTKRQKNVGPCSEDWCHKPAVVRGTCAMHYDRRRSGKTPWPVPALAQVEEVAARCVIDPMRRCWVHVGYPTFDRVSQRIIYGGCVRPLAPHVEVEPTCGQPRCANPDHLRAIPEG